ncbi:MAG: CPBP family intramembrane metalloprotease [Pirellulaceae bacterium]|jgi:membrane protease YdiL (CAAX protease family)|nr:CPBP family intramembrane metalloprotease [Pirellulaceae bacterium]
MTNVRTETDATDNAPDAASADPANRFEWLRETRHRPALTGIIVTVMFVVWKCYGSPDFFRARLSGEVSFTGDVAWDAGLYWCFANFLLLAAIAVVVKFGFRAQFSEFGMGTGRVLFGMSRLAMAAPVLLFLAWMSAQSDAFKVAYPMNKEVDATATLFAFHLFALFTFYVAWECLFRGLLQHGFAAGSNLASAIVVQTLATTLAHVDRPPGEMIGAIFAGLIWGRMVNRSQSVATAIGQHFLIGVAVDCWVCYGS